MGELRRDLFPEPLNYYEAEGLRLVGRTKWRTTRCEFHGGSDSMRINVESGGWCCMACGAKGRDVLSHHMQAHGLEFVEAARSLGAYEDDDPNTTGIERRARRLALARTEEAAACERDRQQREEQHSKWAINAERNASLLAQCVPVTTGDPVHRYLCRRLAIDAFDPPQCLRLHPALDYWHEGQRLGTFPAMVAPLIAPDGRMVALHRTYVTHDGRKADVPKAKKLTGAAGPLAGAGIRLHKPRRGVVGVAEGIETALAASLASGVPMVAAYCAPALASFVWPPGVQRLVIFADADSAGRDAADVLRARALRARLRCDVMTPPTDGADWCDVWAARDAAMVEAAT